MDGSRCTKQIHTFEVSKSCLICDKEISVQQTADFTDN